MSRVTEIVSWDGTAQGGHEILNYWVKPRGGSGYLGSEQKESVLAENPNFVTPSKDVLVLFTKHDTWFVEPGMYIIFNGGRFTVMEGDNPIYRAVDVEQWV